MLWVCLMGLIWRDKQWSHYSLHKSIHRLQKEWTGGFSVFQMSAKFSLIGGTGLAAHMHADWTSLLDQW